MGIADRLGRLLFIVPYVANRDGVPLQELAEKTGASVDKILLDLDLLSMVGRPPLTPDHLIDLYVEDKIVYVDLDQSLTRPLRLTHEEARALVLGAKLVGHLGGLDERLQLVLDKIIQALNPVDREMVLSIWDRIGMWQDGQISSKPIQELHQSIENHQEIKIEYYSVSSDRQKTYRLQPLALITHSGIEYLVAWDQDEETKNQEKIFRLDRMKRVRRLKTTFAPPAEIDLEKYRTPRMYFGDDGSYADVWFSARVAKAVQERFGDAKIQSQKDGSVIVRLSTSSPAWLARWVLPFGLEAEVIGPATQREYFKRLCQEAVEAYQRNHVSD